MAEYVEAYPRERVSALTEAEAVGSRRELVVEDAEMEKEEAKPRKQLIPEQTSYVPLGTCSLQLFFFIKITKYNPVFDSSQS